MDPIVKDLETAYKALRTLSQPPAIITSDPRWLQYMGYVEQTINRLVTYLTTPAQPTGKPPTPSPSTEKTPLEISADILTNLQRDLRNASNVKQGLRLVDQIDEQALRLKKIYDGLQEPIIILDRTETIIDRIPLPHIEKKDLVPLSDLTSAFTAGEAVAQICDGLKKERLKRASARGGKTYNARELKDIADALGLRVTSGGRAAHVDAIREKCGFEPE